MRVIKETKVRIFHNKSPNEVRRHKHQNVDMLINVKTSHTYQAKNKLYIIHLQKFGEKAIELLTSTVDKL